MTPCRRCGHRLTDPWVATPWGAMHFACAPEPGRRPALDGTMVTFLALAGLLVLVVVGIWAAGAGAEQGAERRAVEALPQAPTLRFREFGSHLKAGDSWIIITVAPRPDRQLLIELAAYLHRQRPAQRYRIFDDADGARLRAYLAYEEHHGTPEGKRHPYPEAWITEHQVGRITHLAGDGWTLIDARGEQIVSLE